MPTYEYVCEACKHAWELEQRMVEDPVKKCPKCKKLKAQRVIAGASNFILKGGGWYSDLYASSPKSKSSGDSGASSPSSTPAASTASESKPAAPAKKSGGGSE
jgi:putative FmdB family regulatory protein